MIKARRRCKLRHGSMHSYLSWIGARLCARPRGPGLAAAAPRRRLPARSAFFSSAILAFRLLALCSLSRAAASPPPSSSSPPSPSRPRARPPPSPRRPRPGHRQQLAGSLRALGPTLRRGLVAAPHARRGVPHTGRQRVA